MKYCYVLLLLILVVVSCGSPEQKDASVTLEHTIPPPPDGMVLIPAGSFVMGSDTGDEAPAHTVWIDAFYLDEHEVTNQDYKEFIDSTGHPAPRQPGEGAPRSAACHGAGAVGPAPR